MRKKPAKRPRKVAPTRAKNVSSLNAEGLNPRENLFVSAYVGSANYNGAEAARQAGFAHAGARQRAAELMQRPRVQKAITAAIEERSRAFRVSKDTVLGEAFLSYLEAKGAGQYGAARGFLELTGKHVDVNAFRTILGIGGADGGPVRFNLSEFGDDDLDKLADLLSRAGVLASDDVGDGSGGLGGGDPTGETPED
jgi:hypothetical protein